MRVSGCGLGARPGDEVCEPRQARVWASPSNSAGQDAGRGLHQPSNEDLVGNPVGIGDRAQRHEDGAVRKVRASDHVADAREANGTRHHLEQSPRRTFTLDFFPGSRASVSSTLTLIESRVIPLKILVFVPIF